MIFAAGAVIAVTCCALFGWGYLVRRSMNMANGSWAVSITLGMALWISIGGVLNLARLAGPSALTAMVVVGLMVFVFATRKALAGRSGRLPDGRVLAGRALLMALAIGVLVFTIATQLPPAAYNHFDDFEKYFSHPVRMLQTGTLFGSPLSAIGWESLGGQAFLQGFVVAYFPIRFINGADAVFALFLCLLLIAGFAWRRPAMVPAASLAMIAVVFINPQYVNVSALYTGSALMMAAIFLAGDPAEQGSKPIPAPALGLLYAAAVALKPTFVLFAILHVLFLAAAVAIGKRRPGQGLAWALKAAGWGSVFVVPWIVLHGAHYLSPGAGTMAGAGGGASSTASALLDIFSTVRLYYGGSVAQYTGLVVAVLICAAVVARSPRGDGDRAMSSAAMGVIAGAAAATASYLVIAYVLVPYLGDARTALRYFIPIIIAAMPAILCLSRLHLLSAASPGPSLMRRVIPGAVALIVVASFTPELTFRIRQAVNKGSILAFRQLASSKPFIRYTREVLHGAVRGRVNGVQRRVPAGEPMIAWIKAPFYLDFRRNPIFDVDVAGLATPWSKMPAVRYVMWEYRGDGIRSPEFYKRQARGSNLYDRKIALLSLSFVRRLRKLSGRAEILYDDGRMMLFRLPE